MEVTTPERTGSPPSDVAVLYREEGPRLWRAVFAYAGDREVASDAVAETFAQFIRRGDAIRDPRAWIWHVAFRIAAGELQRRGTQTEVSDDLVELGPESDRLMPALRSLTPRQRAVIVLRYYAGYRPSEIAGILGTKAPTVRVHLMRARRRLADLLEDQDET
jgi:RNA polymerase sigma-70 factor (ECF subfamily)